jgi:phosphate starvation-inducible PhoH-like protein
MSETTITIDNPEVIRTLFGERDRHLRKIRDSVGIEVVIRGDQLRLFGSPPQVERGRQVLVQLQELIEKQGVLRDDEVERTLEGQVPLPDAMVAPTRVPRNGQSPKAASDESDDGAVLLRRASKSSGHSDSAKAEPVSGSISLFEKARKIHARTAGQFEYVEAMRHNDITLCIGPAGSGKTYLAVAMAVNALRQDQIRKIVLVRPAVEAGERLGFLPGDMHAKLNPYLRPLLDALNDILTYDQVKRYLESDVIEIVPLAYMRGRTLNSTFMILDEGQNTTITQMKMFLTRMGYDSKIVVTGDVTQIDLPSEVPSGLIDAFGRLNRLPGLACVQLSTQDIVRHRLVGEIVKAYDGDHPHADHRRNRTVPHSAPANRGSR